MTYKPDVIELPLSYYVDKLRNNEPFIFARYGDGEWLTILGHSTLRNSNGCSFTSELSLALIRAIENQHGFRTMLKVNHSQPPIIKGYWDKDDQFIEYHYALLHITRRKQGGKIVKWLTDNNITMSWYNGDIFLDESLEGNLFPLIEQIRKRRVLYVGNERLRHLRMNRAGFFPYAAYVEPPIQNAFEKRERVLNQVYGAIKKEKIDFIGWSSGLAAKYFIDQVYQSYPEITQLDFGSLFDGYFKPLAHIEAMKHRKKGGVGSRSYIRSGNYDFRELLKMNTNDN